MQRHDRAHARSAGWQEAPSWKGLEPSVSVLVRRGLTALRDVRVQQVDDLLLTSGCGIELVAWGQAEECSFLGAPDNAVQNAGAVNTSGPVGFTGGGSSGEAPEGPLRSSLRIGD